MIIGELLNLGYDDALIAGKLLRFNENYDLIFEATAKVLRFNYERAKNDPRPRVFVLGRWRHPQTGNNLVAGINLNYLSDDELQQLYSHMGQIMKPSRLKNRWWLGYGLLPHIWLKAYRQYDERFIHSVRDADIPPEPEDYEEPKEPGEPQDKEAMPPDEAAALQKLRELEAQRKGESPQEPKKRKSLLRLGKDTLKRIAHAIRNKLFRNRKKEQVKQKQADMQRAEKEKELHKKKTEKEIADLEREKRLGHTRYSKELKRTDDEDEADEVRRLKELEDEHRSESRMEHIDAIIESTVEDRRIIWRSKRNYAYWHRPDRFVQYQPQLRGSILDYSHGTQLIAIYNIVENKLVIDLTDGPANIIAQSGWNWDDAIILTADAGKVKTEHTSETAGMALQELRKHAIWGLLQEASDATFQK